ncbi:hypothetical protein [Halomarina oriensis]|uniref:Uncharacterized protein n=1 Tax=Halomarina oriensis TaxID=671145 RepID=A0A6B0GSV0_9EURY|nr:hypothetical protein [Halomarina oriensis]MWG34748.1 hypothetical protein [Halomarina oriensis]
MSTAELLVQCDENDRFLVEVVDGRDVVERIEVVASEYTPPDAHNSIDRGLLIVQIAAVSDLPESMDHKLDTAEGWSGTLEISARQAADGTWSRPVLQAWQTGTESYVEVGYINAIERV